MAIKHLAEIELAKSSPEVLRLRKRIETINKDIRKIAHKNDPTSKTQRQKLQEDLRISREQKKKLLDKQKTSAAAAPNETPRSVVNKVRKFFKDTKPLPKDVANSPEPVRAAMYHLGYEKYDNTPWWDKVMDIISAEGY